MHRIPQLPVPLAFVLSGLLGVFGGALFGVGFGALASVFHNGPDLATGVRESWAWFAVLGGLLGLSMARMSRLDTRALQSTSPPPQRTHR